MGTLPAGQALKETTSGRGTDSPRVCVVGGDAHVRHFAGRALEELGFVARECSAIDDLSAVLDALAPDLVALAPLLSGTEAIPVLQALAARAYGGSVLLIGPRDPEFMMALQELGQQLGMTILPPLATPFDGTRLRTSVAGLLPVEMPLSPMVDLAEAFRAGWFELWYQPKFNLPALELGGAEALLRLRHPTWGLMAPAHFRPEEGDLCSRVLSDFVIAKAVDDWRYLVAHHRTIDLAVNLPLAFLSDSDSVARLRRQVPDHPAFEGLMVEIDAADIIPNMSSAKALAAQLRHCNIAISVDNLGLEWSSLAGFEDFPFVEIKVDRQSIAGCARDPLKQTLCRRVLDLADSYGARTIAQGVETEPDFLFVRKMGFDCVQGPLLAPPMTARQLVLPALRLPVSAPQ